MHNVKINNNKFSQADTLDKESKVKKNIRCKNVVLIVFNLFLKCQKRNHAFRKHPQQLQVELQT